MKRRGRPPHPDILTPREWEVLEFLRLGLSNEQIAERLGITLRTAKFHVSEILSKLGVESREQAAAWQPAEAPAPARRWLAWPLVARPAGALVVVAAVTGLGLLAWGVLRTGAGDEEATGDNDATAAIQEAVLTVGRSDSYRVEQDFNGDGELDSIGEWASPGISHGWTRADPTRADPDIVWYESIVASQRQFSRSCRTLEDCEAWREYPRSQPEDTPPDSVVIAVNSPLGPGGLVQTLQLTRDLEYVGGPGTRHIRGVTNPIRAIVQSLRAALPGLDSKVYEMAAQALDDGVRFYDANPAPIEIWLSPEGFPTRVVLEQDANHSQGTGKVDAHLSRFNEVTITPPTEFIPLSTPTP
jgi:DNA-binding CsgD family transcriptional regulator